MIAVVGAGLTGLALGRALLDRGRDVVILEAEPVPGGVIRSMRAGGDLLELGPQRTRWTEGVALLASSLGIADRVVTAPPDLPLFIVYDGVLRRAPLSLADLLRTDLLPARAKLRALLEPFARPPRADETAAQYLARRFGRTTYERLLAPLFGGLYASDPAHMLARHALDRIMRDFGIHRAALPRLLRVGFAGGAGRSGAPPCSFDGGLSTFADALYRAVSAHTRLDTPATGISLRGGAVEPTADSGIGAAARVAGNSHRRFAVDTLTGAVPADHVVLTCDAAAAARLLERVAPDAASRLRTLRYNRIALVHMRSDARIRAAGYQVAFTEPLRTRGVTFNNALFGRTGIYTAFLGGSRDPNVVDESDAAIGAIAAAEFEQVTGAGAEPIHVSRTWIPAWDRSWTALEGLRLPSGIHLCANYESRVGIPGRIAAASALAAHLA